MDGSEKRQEALLSTIDQFSGDMPNQISLAIKEILEKELTDIDFAEDVNVKPLDEIVHSYMKKIGPKLTDVSQRIADVLNQNMREVLEKKKSEL